MSDERAFEELQRELEDVVARLERGDVPVDDAIALFRRGEELYRACVARLEAAELQIEQLTRQEEPEETALASRIAWPGGRASCMNRAMAKPSAELLRKVRLFESLEDRDLESLAEEFNERRFPAGHAVALEGEGGLVFFVVESGEASVEVHGEQVGTLGPGDAFGEIALIDRRPRTATVTATSDITAYSLPVFVFRPFVESRPQVAWTLLEAMADRLVAAESR